MEIDTKLDFKFLNNYINVSSTGYAIEIYEKSRINEYYIGKTFSNGTKINSDTLYDIASLTKMFTALLVYKAIEENKLSLNDNIYKLDNKFIKLKNVSIKDLLAHRKEIWTDKHLRETINKEDYYNTVYNSYIKSNNPKYVDLHYIILGIILEKVYKKSYLEILKEKIVIPLGITSLTFMPEGNNIAKTSKELSSGIINDSKARIALRYGIYTSHAGIFINANDMMKVLSSILNCTIIKQETLKIALSHDDINKQNYNYLSTLSELTDVNEMYKEIKENNPEFNVQKTYNYFGTRYRNNIDYENEIPTIASDNSIYFSGFTGPAFLIDFKYKIIILVMSNGTYIESQSRYERKLNNNKIIDRIFTDIVKAKKMKQRKDIL